MMDKEEVVKKEIEEKLRKVGLICGYDYDFTYHPELAVWAGRYDVAKKIRRVLGKWGFNIDFQGGYYYWNIY